MSVWWKLTHFHVHLPSDRRKLCKLIRNYHRLLSCARRNYHKLLSSARGICMAFSKKNFFHPKRIDIFLVSP